MTLAVLPVISRGKRIGKAEETSVSRAHLRVSALELPPCRLPLRLPQPLPAGSWRPALPAHHQASSVSLSVLYCQNMHGPESNTIAGLLITPRS